MIPLRWNWHFSDWPEPPMKRDVVLPLPIHPAWIRPNMLGKVWHVPCGMLCMPPWNMKRRNDWGWSLSYFHIMPSFHSSIVNWRKWTWRPCKAAYPFDSVPFMLCSHHPFLQPSFLSFDCFFMSAWKSESSYTRGRNNKCWKRCPRKDCHQRFYRSILEARWSWTRTSGWKLDDNRKDLEYMLGTKMQHQMILTKQ